MFGKLDENLSNSDNYEKIIDTLDRRGKIIGLDILKKPINTPANFLLKFAIVDVFLYHALILYFTYLVYGDFLQSAFCWTTFGLGLDSIMKYYVFIFKRRDLHRIQDDMRTLFRRYEASDDEGSEKLRKILRISSILNFLTFLCFLNTGFSLNSLTMTESFRTGEKTLIFGFHLPIIDHTTHLGYAINYAYQNLQMLLVIFHSSQGDGFYIVHMVLACARLEAIIHQIEVLDRYLISPDRDTLSDKEDKMIIDEYLKDILQQHLDHIEYMNRMESLYSGYSFLLVCSCMMVVVINVFVLLSIFWLSGIFLSLAVFVKIMAFCVLGTVVTEHQKSLLFLLQSAQKPVEATMMKFKPLNLTTFLKCLNMIYSVCAMLFTMTRKK
ncbi:hypothetical protein DMENIID0001_021250 [Sergentomyia squamirostris]